MLLFSTILKIKPSMTPDDFIRLVLKWNANSPHADNVIPDIEWHGEKNIRYGTDDLWLGIEEYRNKNIIAVRYEKAEDDGVIWDTDYVMNFDEMKMAIQLDRSYRADAQIVDLKFSTPYFISLLIENGYLEDDGLLSIDKQPVVIERDNLSLLADVINGNANFEYPVVYVSKNRDGSDPVDIRFLASKLKGTAHVLVQQSQFLNGQIREACNDQNEYSGAVGIYFPHNVIPNQRFFYRGYFGFDEIQFEKIVRSVFQYANRQNVQPLYTWMGVNNALLRDRWSSRGEELIAARNTIVSALNAQKVAEIERDRAEMQKDAAVHQSEEAQELIETTDAEIADFKQQIISLTHDVDRLQAENAGLRMKLQRMDAEPILFTGSESDFFPGEIKDIVLSILADALDSCGGDQATSRRADVLQDILNANQYEELLDKKAEELKNKLKGYKTLTGALRNYLEDLGFTITEDGKHYRLTYYGDARYHTTIAKSASDHREGQNIAAVIKREML